MITQTDLRGVSLPGVDLSLVIKAQTRQASGATNHTRAKYLMRYITWAILGQNAKHRREWKEAERKLRRYVATGSFAEDDLDPGPPRTLVLCGPLPTAGSPQPFR